MTTLLTRLSIPPGFMDSLLGMPLWQKILIWIASLAVPVGLMWMFFFSPRIGELKTLMTNIPRLAEEVRILEEKAGKLPQIRQEIQEMEAILANAMKLLPETKDIPSVLTGISNIGNEERLEFQLFKPENEQKQAFYASIPVNLEFSGPFHNTVHFFDEVSRMDRIVHIQEVTMGQAKEAPETWSQAAAPTETAGSPSDTGPGPPPEGLTEASRWVIKTKCQAVTYRFLTPEEQKAEAEKASKAGKKK